MLWIIAGMLAGFFTSPCATPVLVVLLAMGARQGQLLTGVFLLAGYMSIVDSDAVRVTAL